MTPEQAIQILTQVVNATRALPNEVDTMRQALRVLQPKVEPKAE